MQDTYYHTCGYPILVEISNDAARFRDGAQDGVDEALDACPNCGELLLLGDLTPEPVDEWW